MRLLGVGGQAIRWGAMSGGLAAVFFGAQGLGAVARGTDARDGWATFGAGGVAGAAGGLAFPGGAAKRLRAAAIGAGLGLLLCVPLAAAQAAAAEYGLDFHGPAGAFGPPAAARGLDPDRDVVTAVIAKFEREQAEAEAARKAEAEGEGGTRRWAFWRR